MSGSLPENIRRYTDGKPFTTDTVGRSGSAVYSFDDMVLKIERDTAQTAASVGMLRWLSGRLPVPEVICHTVRDGKSYLLMSRIKGRISCDRYYLERPQELISALAQAVRMLWSVDISDCPRTRLPDDELADARLRVEQGLIDLDRAEPDTFGEGGFKDPAELLEWLENNRPDTELCLSHGDLCLPNILLDDSRVSGFIDLGDCGAADKWRDLALLHRSIRHNVDGTFGGKVYPGIDADKLFEALGIQPNSEKLRYYLLLDELF